MRQAQQQKAHHPGPRLLEVYHRLFQAYGPQNWWPGEGPLEVIIGAILTQGTSWKNVEKALDNLKREGVLTLRGLRELPLPTLARLLRPSGYYNAKARKVRAFVEFLGENYQDDLAAFLAQDTPTLRRELLSIYGIGEETADDIILYAARKPTFVVDAYTRRILHRLGMVENRLPYQGLQALFLRHLPPDPELLGEYHALLVRHGKDTCRQVPRCRGCCLLQSCPTGFTRLSG